MGFGILFFGFLITYLGAITPLYVFTYTIGAIIILYSLKNLIAENKAFLTAVIITVALELVSVAELVFFALDKQGKAYSILGTIQTYMSIVLAFVLLLAIYKIAKSVGLIKIQSKVIVNFFFVGIGIVFSILASVLSDKSYANYIALVAIFAQLLYVVFSLVIIFNFYVIICYAGDEDMSNQNTGFTFLNTLNSKLNSALDKNKDLNNKGRKK